MPPDLKKTWHMNHIKLSRSNIVFWWVDLNLILLHKFNLFNKQPQKTTNATPLKVNSLWSVMKMIYMGSYCCLGPNKLLSPLQAALTVYWASDMTNNCKLEHSILSLLFDLPLSQGHQTGMMREKVTNTQSYAAEFCWQKVVYSASTDTEKERIYAAWKDGNVRNN